ncbi:MAG: helix-turn-helix transcriptional regulator [Phycisphaerales bacterium]|nr:helix-turn-helix transcriptional regulator [Phycisphaerales bacterium]
MTDVIGRQLRAVRRRYGLTGAELAQRLGCGQARVSKIETGKLRPSVEYVRRFAEVLGLSAVEARQLETATGLFLLEFDRWHMAASGMAADIQRRVAKLEQQARVIRSLEWFALSGLLQTRAYATHVYRTFREMSPMDARQAVDERMRRQEILEHKSRAFTFIVAEHVLLTNFCPRHVALEQIDRLRWVARLPNVAFRLLPLGHPVNVVPATGFDIFDDRFVFIETRDFQVRVWNEQEVRGYLADFHSLESSCLHQRGDIEAVLRRVSEQVRLTW